MTDKLTDIWKKLGFTLTIVTIGLALHGANDLRKNLCYNCNQAMAAEIKPVDKPITATDSKGILVKPLFSIDQLEKIKRGKNV